MEVNRFRHVRFSFADEISYIPEAMYKVKNLRTFLSAAPKLINNIYAAQTLVLKNCFKLKDLPGDVNKLLSLRHLSIYKTRDHDWIPPMPNFPLLNLLHVDNCPKLVITPTRFPSLKTLKYVHSNGEPIRSLVDSNLASLTSVEIKECEELVFLPQGLVRGNNILGQLKVTACENFKGFNPDQALEEEREVQSLPNNSLVRLHLLICPGLLSWPDLRRSWTPFRFLMLLLKKEI
ncbi:hypothetical protein MKX03_016043 [Papaver bracteatum]|nr:hypothetical protein MKX03_016043 [Papaver bracteatum]